MGDWQPIEAANREMRLICWDGFSVFEGYTYGNGDFYTAGSHSYRPWVEAWMPLPTPPVIEQMTGNPAKVGV